VVSANFLASEWALWETMTSVTAAVAEKRDSLVCYFGRASRPAHGHGHGQQIASAYPSRESGIPELITDSDVVVLLGGAKSTQYLGVLALLERRVVFPLAATGGAAADLHTIILSRYERTFANRLPINKFRALANVNAKPAQLAGVAVELIDLCS
jgi:hypothetical protein